VGVVSQPVSERCHGRGLRPPRDANPPSRSSAIVEGAGQPWTSPPPAEVHRQVSGKVIGTRSQTLTDLDKQLPRSPRRLLRGALQPELRTDGIPMRACAPPGCPRFGLLPGAGMAECRGSRLEHASGRWRHQRPDAESSQVLRRERIVGLAVRSDGDEGGSGPDGAPHLEQHGLPPRRLRQDSVLVRVDQPPTPCTAKRFLRSGYRLYFEPGMEVVHDSMTFEMEPRRPAGSWGISVIQSAKDGASTPYALPDPALATRPFQFSCSASRF
jgi:hypothetical protein